MFHDNLTSMFKINQQKRKKGKTLMAHVHNQSTQIIWPLWLWPIQLVTKVSKCPNVSTCKGFAFVPTKSQFASNLFIVTDFINLPWHLTFVRGQPNYRKVSSSATYTQNLIRNVAKTLIKTETEIGIFHSFADLLWPLTFSCGHPN